MVDDNKEANDTQTIKRDNKGRLLPGSKLVSLRKEARGGPTKKTGTLLRECISERKPELIEKAIDLALYAKDERVRADATFKLLAYVEGAPPSKTDITLRRGVDEVTPGELAELTQRLELALANQCRLLSPPASVEENHALQRQEQGQELASMAYEGEAVEAKG